MCDAGSSLIGLPHEDVPNPALFRLAGELVLVAGRHGSYVEVKSRSAGLDVAAVDLDAGEPANGTCVLLLRQRWRATRDEQRH